MTAFEFHSVTPERLNDLSRFSESHGKFRYCSCMRWRMRSTDFQHSITEQRVAALDAAVQQNLPVGILAYANGDPVGWCSVAPREMYAALERYKALPRLDDQPVWSIVCFFVDSRYRRQGMTLGLLKAAVEYTCSRGAQIIEGYPVEADARLYQYMGSLAAFKKAGFRDVTPPGKTRRVMRYFVQER